MPLPRSRRCCGSWPPPPGDRERTAQLHATDNTTITGQHRPADARYTTVQVLRWGVWTDQPRRWPSTSTGSYSLPFAWERGHVGTYRARVAVAQPNATWLCSPAVSIRRYANLRAVVRAVTTGTQMHNFPIKSTRNPNDWGGDDVKMMAAGNTSAFTC